MSLRNTLVTLVSASYADGWHDITAASPVKVLSGDNEGYTGVEVTGMISASTKLSAAELSLGGTNITSSAAELNKLDGYTGSVTELNYLDTLHATGVTNTEFDYLDGVSSNLQTQFTACSANLSPLIGSSSITTVGTIGTGTWQGTAIADGYIASASTWNGKQDSLTFGISNTNAVKIDGGDIADDEYARFTANGLESRTAAEVAAHIQGNIFAVGTIAAGTWQGTAVADTYVASSALWNWVASNSATKYGDTSVYGTLSARDRIIASNGASLSGDVTIGGSIELGDSQKVAFGNKSGGDGSIKHTGSNLQIQETTGNIQIINYANDNDITLSTDDGSGGTTEYLRLDGSTTTVEIAKKLNVAEDTTVSGTLSAQSHLTAGNGSVAANLSGAVAISGNITKGTWQGTAIAQAYIANDAINGDKIADDAVNSEHYADGSIDTAHIADDQVTLAKMANLTIGSIIHGDSSGNPGALAIGSANTVLQSDGTNVSYGTVSNAMLTGSIANSKLANSAVTLSAGDGLKTGGSVALGASVTLDVDVSDFAGDGLQDAGSENLAVDVSDFAGTGLEDDGSENLRLASQGTGIAGGGGSTLSVAAAQTSITSITNSALAIGYGSSHANIDFSTDNSIVFDIDGTSQIQLDDGVFKPTTDSDVDLGTSSLYFKTAFVDTLSAARVGITGKTTINGICYTWPSSDGSDGQVLHTDGSGTLSWAADDSGGGGGGGLSWDGSTANGVATYKDADEATVEANLTFDGTDLTVAGGGSIYADKIRRASDSGTTTKILLNDEALKLYAGHSSNNICTIDSTGLTIDNGSLETATIDYTDGDLAMTIADGGKVTFAAGFDVGSDAAGDILYHNGTSYVRLAKSTDDKVLTLTSGLPAWETASGGGGGGDSHTTTTVNANSADWTWVAENSAGRVNYATTESVIVNQIDDIYWSYVTVLLPLDTGINDISGEASNRLTFTPAGNAAINTSTKKFGAGSLALDGTGDYIVTDTDSAHNRYGIDPLTWECWVNFSAIPSNDLACIMSNQDIVLDYDNRSSAAILRWFYHDGSSHQVSSVSWSPSTGTWYHLAGVRSGTTWALYVDGTRVINTTISVSQVMGHRDLALNIGRFTSSTPRAFNGYIDDIRITKGVARYSGADATGDIPAAALPQLTQSLETLITGLTAASPDTKFTTVTLSGTAIGADIVADTATDTLTLSAGPNIALISDPTTDTISISARAGGGGGGSSVSFGADNQIPYMNAAGDDFEYESNLTWGHGSNILLVAGDIEIAAKMFHKDDSNTFFHFQDADTVRIVVGGDEYLSIDMNSANEVCINENGESVDFRVESNNDANMIFVDGSADAVGIGTATPTAELTVAGEVSASDGFSSAVKPITTLTSNGVVTYDITGPALQTVILKANQANTYLGTETLPAGKTITARLSANGANRTLAWHSSWNFIGEKPTSIAQDKIALLSVTTFGTLCGANGVDTDVVCAYAVED